MGRTCGEPDEIELTAMGVKLNGSGRVHKAAPKSAQTAASVVSPQACAAAVVVAVAAVVVAAVGRRGTGWWARYSDPGVGIAEHAAAVSPRPAASPREAQTW